LSKIAKACEASRRDECIADASAIILKLDPDNAEAHLALGNIYASRGLHTDAEKHLMVAMAARPESAVPRNNLGLTFFELFADSEALLKLAQGRRVEAIEILERAAIEIDVGGGGGGNRIALHIHSTTLRIIPSFGKMRFAFAHQVNK
jgi:tetratricopeptide (TPR) repeat protein